MPALKCLLIFVFTCTGVALELNSGPSSSCMNTTLESKKTEVFIGWPHKILCNLVDYGVDYSLYDYLYKDFDINDEVVCSVWTKNGTLVFNESGTYEDMSFSDNMGYLTPDLHEGDNVNFTLQVHVIGWDNCVSTKIHLDLKPFQERSCEEELNKFVPLYIPATVGGEKRFSCDVSNPTVYASDVMYNWSRNCSYIRQNLANGEKNLLIEDISFDDAGVYMCSVTYKGMTRYSTSYGVCVQHPPTKNQQALSCDDLDIKKNKGNDASFDCKANYGEGTLTQEHFSFFWVKQLNNGSFTKRAPCASTTEETNSKEKISCIYNLEEHTCLYRIASEEQRQPKPAIVPVQLIIRDIEESDYGTYVIISESHTVGVSNVNITLKLEANPIPKQLNVISIVGICLVVLVLVLILMAIIIYKFKLYLKVYFKRYAGAYVAEERQYGAYLSYNFSSKSDTFEKVALKETITLVRDLLESMNFRIYDEMRDGFIKQSRAENIHTSIRSSHRVIIFLTLNYIQNDWCLREINECLQEMIHSQTRLIFFLAPGIKEYLKQHRKDKKDAEKNLAASTYAMIERAINLNYAIECKEKKLSKTLIRFKLEEAMPKLRSQHKEKLTRFSFPSTSDFESPCDYKNVKFLRGFSNETQCTEVDIPACHVNIKCIEEEAEKIRRTFL